SIGGQISTLEVFDKRTLRHHEFMAHNMPPVHEIEYLDHYAGLNLRLPAHASAKLGDLLYDYPILDGDAMKRSPFYAEFLPRFNCRYFVSGIVASSDEEFTAVTVQRSVRDGHIDRPGIAIMRQLLPHVRQAFDMTRRFKESADIRHSLERALDWLA